MNAFSKRQWPAVKYESVQLGGGTTSQGVSYPGGLDLTTPSLRLSPGALRDCLNYECVISGGYGRIDGYERLDGREAPSDAIYTIVQVVSFTNVPSVGQTITQTTSGATGKIIVVVAGATPYVAVTQVTGAFDITHAITTPGPVAVGTATGLTVSLTAKQRAQYKALAAGVYRALIGAVPGTATKNVLGVVGMIIGGADQKYAFRETAGNVLLYKATNAGWVLVPYFNLISFVSGGSTLPVGPTDPGYIIPAGATVTVDAPLSIQSPGGLIVRGTLIVVPSGTDTIPLDGETLTQGAVTAIIKRVMTQSGSWSGTATGQFVITNPSGGNFVAGAATTSGGATLILSGVQTAITMAPGGRFEFTKCNFSGQAATRRIYGCDGVNPCFEFDGETLAPIKTGLAPDAPTHITNHKSYLFISQGSSILHPGPGLPFKWSAIDGGGEIACGDTVNGMITLPGSQTTATLGVFLRGNTAFLYGTDPSTFNFVTFNTGVGALAYSAQNLFDTFILDDLGVVTLKTTLNYGNFLPSTLTRNILPFIQRERENLTTSSVNREKAQYRLFFSDGYALYCTVINQQYLGAMPVLFPNPVLCCDETDLVGGGIAGYFASNDGQGYVYELDKGTSFDGADINGWITCAWDAVKSPRVLKRFRAASIEVQGSGYAEISYGYQLAYGSPQTEQPSPIGTPLNLSRVPYWDSFIWDNFEWDGLNLMPSDVDETGTGENIQVMITSGTNYIPAFTLNSVIHHFTPRRGLRV